MFKIVVFGSLGICTLLHVTCGEVTNVAVGKPTEQAASLNFSGFVWSSNKAVDDCLDTTDPETSECCSASQGNANNYWKVDLLDQYIVSSIIIFGRSDSTAATGGQLDGFLVFVEEKAGDQEELVYNNTGMEYGNGTFFIPLNDKLVSVVMLRRPTATIMTICEVQVFAEPTVTMAPSTDVNVTPETTEVTPETTKVTPETTDDNTSPDITTASSVSSSITVTSSNLKTTDSYNGVSRRTVSWMALASLLLTVLIKH